MELGKSGSKGTLGNQCFFVGAEMDGKIAFAKLISEEKEEERSLLRVIKEGIKYWEIKK